MPTTDLLLKQSTTNNRHVQTHKNPSQSPLDYIASLLSKLNSTVYFFFGVFLGLTALIFFGDLVAFFAGLADFLSLLQN
jgi:ABC-type bacteriocin/lantibiotic exporter with double-glycine peptidase domain